MKQKHQKKLFKHQLFITIVCVFVLVIGIISSSHLAFSKTSKKDEYNVLKVGDLEVSYVDTGIGYGDILSLNGSSPISDKEGSSNLPYRFNITNTGSTTADFKIKIEYDESIIEEDGCSNNLLSQKYIKYKFDNNSPILLSEKESTDYLIYEAKDLLPGSSEIHEIRIWIDENAPSDIAKKHFHGKVSIIQDESIIEYKIGQQVTLKDGSSWHVLEESSNRDLVVTLLSDYNLNLDGTYYDSCNTFNCAPQAFDIENNRLPTSNSYCTSPEYGCNQYEQNGSTVVVDSSIKTWLDTVYLPILTQSLMSNGGNVEDLVVSLPTMEQLAKADNQTFQQNQINFTSDWLTNTNYWTKTAFDQNSSYVWSVFGQYNNGYVQYANEATQSGVRPVIVVSKQNIEN